MKWFKHFSSARYDSKMMRLINKYGLEGYGLYFLIVESVAFQLSTDKPVPDLEETAADIAQFTGVDTLRIQEMIEFCLEQKLFEYNHDTGRIMCIKILTHLDNTLSNNPEIKKILSNFNKLQETSSNLKQIRLDKIRLDKNNKEAPTLKEIQDYITEKDYNVDAKQFYDYFTTGNWTDSKGNKVKNWKQKIITWNNHSKKKNDKDKEFDELYNKIYS